MTCLITLKSQTYSMKAQKILYENGISASVTKLDGEYAKKGCAYGIKFDCRNRIIVKRLLQDKNIQYSDIRSI